MKHLELNKTQALGLTLIICAVATRGIPSTWLSAWTPDIELHEAYEGYDIYYIPEAGVYAIDVGGPVDEWSYFTDIQGARNKIDLWNLGPIWVEEYRDFTLYQVPGYSLFYATRGETRTNNWDSVEKVKAYVDGEYYPTLVYTIHCEAGDYLIYRIGYHSSLYWGELDGYSTPEFSSLADAKEFVYDRIKELAPVENPTETPTIEPEVPVQEEPVSESNPEDTSNTVGSKYLQQRTLISAFMGVTGVGCFVYGTGAREEE